MADLLLELFSEEIPARMQSNAVEHLREALYSALSLAGFSDTDHADYTGFVTPRRLAVWVKHLPVAQAASEAEIKGPKVGAPEAALQGFLKKNGLTAGDLAERDGVYFAVVKKEGRDTAAVLKESIEKILAEFPWPKSMRWGSAQARWVRPLHSILCIFDGKVVPVAFAGVQAGNVTYGHRFLSPGAITIAKAEEYEAALEQAKVIVNRARRMELVKAKAEDAAKAAGLALKPDDGLLEEVTGLVEWPVALLGTIDAKYMDLPPEVLISEMRGHQKYFALTPSQPSPPGGEGKGGEVSPLANKFLITANMETLDGGKAVIAGNERVLRARLADGRFFWDQDRKKTLEEWAEGLKSVTYHAKLGTVAQKVERVAALAEALAEIMEKNGGKQAAAALSAASCDVQQAHRGGNLNHLAQRAAQLCKADLVTGMVGEFPELQGVMGRYYALHQGEDAAVADAIRDHYKPLGPSDSVPTAPVSACVALADKLDTLTSLFAIGEKPTGSKDPFALRRAALGVIRIVLENGIRLPLAKQVSAELLAFFHDRLKVQLKEQGIRHDLIAAVVADGDDDLVRIWARAKALQSFLATDDGANLLAAYKRAANILAIEEKKDKAQYHASVNAALLALTEEKALHEVLSATLNTAQPLLKAENYTAAMEAFSRLRAPVDAFFDKVLVNDKDSAIRVNRLNLLAQMRATLDNIANFSLIEG